jgi:hypothetical protein
VPCGRAGGLGHYGENASIFTDVPMRTRWFGDLDERRLDGPLRRLVAELARLLDGLASPPVAPGGGRVDAATSAVVLPHAGIPGCRLVVQVAEWSGSVGCWWTVGEDPLAGPATPELFLELPLRPDGIGQAVAWVERELRRPVLVREHGYGPVRRRRWALELDDGRELPVRARWLPGWTTAQAEPTTLAGTGRDPGPGSRLLGVAVTAAVARWTLAASTPVLVAPAWADGAVRVLDVVALATLVAWFRVAAPDRPARVRVPVLAGLLLATLGQVAALVPGPVAAPSPDTPAGQALGLFLRASFPTLLGGAALACWLAAFLAMPGRGGAPAALPVAAGVAWGLDTAVGLWWLVTAPPDPAEAPPVWDGVAAAVLRAATIGLAVLLLLAVADRRLGLDRRAARAGLAGGVLLVAAESVALQAGVGLLVQLLPVPLWFGLLGATPALAWFAGAALIVVAAAQPRTPSSDEGSPRPSAATASNRHPTAKPNRDE